MTKKSEAEVEYLLSALRLYLPPDMFERVRSGLVEWQKLVELRERARVLKLLRAAACIDLKLIPEALELAGQSDLPAEFLICALNAQAASEQCGRPS
jgi:hypothetical protein